MKIDQSFTLSGNQKEYKLNTSTLFFFKIKIIPFSSVDEDLIVLGKKCSSDHAYYTCESWPLYGGTTEQTISLPFDWPCTEQTTSLPVGWLWSCQTKTIDLSSHPSVLPNFLSLIDIAFKWKSELSSEDFPLKNVLICLLYFQMCYNRWRHLVKSTSKNER